MAINGDYDLGGERGVPKGIKEMHDLLTKPTFREGFLQVQTDKERKAIELFDKGIADQAKRSARDRCAEEAARRLGLPIADAQNKGEEWGAKLREVAEEIVGEQVLDNGAVRKIKRINAESQKIQKDLESSDEYIAKKALLLSELNLATRQQEAVMEKLAADVKARQNDPKVAEALDVWGQSPDSTGSKGVDQKGFNSGVVHYFEYRSRGDKNGRYQFSETTPVSLDGFINYSLKLEDLIDNPRPGTNPEVASSSKVVDELGQERLYLLTKSGNLIVAFKSFVQGGGMRVITDIPGQTQKDLAKRTNEELAGSRESLSRLNVLGQKRREVTV